MEMPIVSIVIPTYNCGKYIQRCIESVLAQTYSNLDIIIIDDGSTDQTALICKNYSDKLTYMYQENSGPAVARNKGIGLAKGEYITFVDADDYIDADYIQIMMNLINKFNTKIAMCSCLKTSGVQSISMSDTQNEELIIDAEAALENLFYKKKITPYAIGKIYASEIIGERLFPVDLRLGEDLQFIYEILKKGYSVAYTSLRPYFYCQNETSITHNFKLSVAAAHWKQLCNILNESNDELEKAVISRLFIVAYDFLSQMPKDKECENFRLEMLKFIDNKKIEVLFNDKNKAIVKEMAILSFFSAGLTTSICKMVKHMGRKNGSILTSREAV